MGGSYSGIRGCDYKLEALGREERDEVVFLHIDLPGGTYAVNLRPWPVHIVKHFKQSNLRMGFGALDNHPRPN